MAVCADDADVIKMLISFGANVDKMTKTKPETALHVAANKGLFSAVEALVQGNANTCVLNERGMFPIHLACEQDHYEVVEYLIKHTSQWEIEKCDRSPLHCCADRDRYYTAELLLENGYNVNSEMSDRESKMFRDHRTTGSFQKTSKKK